MLRLPLTFTRVRRLSVSSSPHPPLQASVQKLPLFLPSLSMRAALSKFYETKPDDEMSKDKKDKRIETHLKKLEELDITNCGDWAKMTPAKLEAAGIPPPIIDFVFKGMWLPTFKYADKLDFMKQWATTRNLFGPAVEAAESLDANWVLNRPHCNWLCTNYDAVVELTFSAAIRHWSNRPNCPPDLEDKSAPKFLGQRIWHLHEYGFVLPYPKHHDLLWRASLIWHPTFGVGVSSLPDPSGPDLKQALQTISLCSIENKYVTGETPKVARRGVSGSPTEPFQISCQDFFRCADQVDKFLFPLLEHMSRNAMKHDAPR